MHMFVASVDLIIKKQAWTWHLWPIGNSRQVVDTRLISRSRIASHCLVYLL